MVPGRKEWDVGRFRAVGTAVVALLVGLAIGAIPAQSQPGQRTTIQALDLDRDDRGFEVDNNAKGFSKGDSFGFASPLLNPESRDKIGNIKVICDNILVSQSREAATLLCRESLNSF